jgi:hypothetical protein
MSSNGAVPLALPSPLQHQEYAYAQARNVYVVLPDVNTRATEHNERRRANRSCCGCTVICLALFIAIFFFVQREPTAWLSEVNFTEMNNTTFTAAGDFGFENR